MSYLTQTKRNILESYICTPDKRDDNKIQRNNIALITICDVKKLKPGIWLNNNIINYFTYLLSKRDEKICATQQNKKPSHFFTLYLITLIMSNRYHRVRSWGGKVKGKNIFDLQQLFLPVNIDNSH